MWQKYHRLSGLKLEFFIHINKKYKHIPLDSEKKGKSYETTLFKYFVGGKIVVEGCTDVSGCRLNVDDV